MDTTRTTLSCGGHAWPAVATGEVGAIGRALERAQPDEGENDVRHIECGGHGTAAGRGFSRARARPSLSLSLRHNAREGTHARTHSMHDQWAETSDDPRPLVSGPKREGGMPTETTGRGDANREKRKEKGNRHICMTVP